MSASKDKRSTKRKDDERGHKKKGKKKPPGGDPRSLERNRESNQKGPYSFESSKTKLANVLSYFTSAEAKE